METIRFSDVTFSYPLSNGPALSHVDLQIGKSQFVIVCGKSGCGKTTLLRHIKKNLIPYGNFEGSVTYEGREISGLDDRQNASEIGFVQQNPDNQIVTDKVWHELAFGLESLGLANRAIKRRVAEMASYFDIQEWFRKDVSQLSGGQKQLLNLASVMAMQPNVLVLDEPTSQLDPIAASDFLRTIQKINRDLGTTIILSEHRLEEAFTMADMVCVMDKGRVVAYDSPRRIGSFLAGSRVADGGYAADTTGAGAPVGQVADPAVGSGSAGSGRHPMFYGLPAITKIYHDAGGTGDSPLTIREGRLWIDEKMKDSGISPAETSAIWQGIEEEKKPEKIKDPAISMSNLWFRYDKGKDILRGLSLDVAKGQLFCILGGNGVGKSTTLKLISGILKAQRGKVRVDGRFAMLPQNPQALFTEISCEEELLEALHYITMTDEEKVKAVRHMLAMMEMDHLATSHPYDLSGGEQQRLALGKVLLLDPDVILLDEATKGLDPFFKITLAGILKKLTEQGKTLFMVSHDIEFCAEYADTCAMFFDGDIVSVGTPGEFFPGNNFYTTTANRMAREYFPRAITWEEVAECIRQNT